MSVYHRYDSDDDASHLVRHETDVRRVEMIAPGVMADYDENGILISLFVNWADAVLASP